MAKSPPYPVYKPKRRPAVHQSKAPNPAPVIVAYAALCVVVAVLAGFSLVPETVSKLIFAFGTIAALTAAAIYQVHFKFRHAIVKKIAFLAIPVWVIGSAFIVYTGIVYPAPILDQVLTREARSASFELPAGSYRVYVHGSFPELDAHEESASPTPTPTPAVPGAPTPTPKKQTYTHKGNFVLALTAAGSGGRTETLSGHFQASAKRQRVAKKGSNIVASDNTRKLFDVRLRESGPHAFELKNLDPELSNHLRIEVFPPSLWHIPVAILGLLATIALTFIDFLIRESREYSFLGVCASASFSFAMYYRLQAMPDTSITVLVMTALVGAIIGVAFGMLLEFALRRVFYRVNRDWRFDVNN
ncbi:MAG: hypothetical protein KJ042_03390 [Deltaproteobacteria bacterium]|nr:hypothetical protein [Deltaproteobacteria bacterium]